MLAPELSTLSGLANPRLFDARSDLATIEGSRKRLFRLSAEPLSAEVILQDIQARDRKRAIVICNTVAKSQSLFQNLQEVAPTNVEITLLHSRFSPEDRKEKEARLQKVFEEDWQKQNDGVCRVLISTQVVEAGINITSQVMHTQLCPMNALLQRAGRCARFRGEEGQVIVYRQMLVGDDCKTLAESEDDDEAIAQSENRQQRKFLPYLDQICERTWEALLEHQASKKADKPVGFEIEEEWINQVHGEEDRLQAGKRSRSKSQFETNFDAAVFQGAQKVANDLIRHVDNRSVFMIEDPTMIDLDLSNDVDVKQLQPFSLPRTTLINIWREYLDSHDQTWMFKKIMPPKSSEDYALPEVQPVKTETELTESIRLLVNPKYVSYDSSVGLQIGVHIYGSYKSPKRKLKAKISKEYSYQMDTYLGHLGRIWTCWERDFAGELLVDGQPTPVILSSSSAELRFAGGRFIARKFFPQATLSQTTALFEFLVFLAVITHDLGKLQVKWQEAMGGWQKIANQYFNGKDPGSLLLAHTDFNPSDEKTIDADGNIQKDSLKMYEAKNQRPNHAMESGFLCFEILQEVLIPVLQEQFKANERQTDLICHTIEMAAGRHHSAWAKDLEDSNKKIHLHPKANEAIQQSWRRLCPRLKGGLVIPDQLPQFEQTYEVSEFPLGKKIREDDLPYQQLYWLVVRALRICDGRSVQLH